MSEMYKGTAVIYNRVSDPSQIENNSLETQEKACRQKAKSMDLQVLQVFTEPGVSAKSMNRKQLAEMLKFCLDKKNHVDYVIVYRFNRLSRVLHDGLVIEARLAKRGVRVISVNEAADDNPMGTLAKNIAYAIGQFENEVKGVVVKENMQTLFRKGNWPWKTPPGYYRKEGSPEVLPHPILGPTIKLLFEMAKTGIYNKTQLANYLNENGYLKVRGNKATVQTITEILQRTFYHGLMYAPRWDEYQVGLHAPLVTEETWNLSYQKMFKSGLKYKHQDSETFPLKGSLLCVECGTALTSSNPKGHTNNYLYYECHKVGCKKTRMPVARAHTQFIELLQKVKLSDPTMKLFAKMVFGEWDAVIEKAESELGKIDARVRILTQEIRDTAASNNKGILSDGEAKVQVANIRIEIDALELQRADVVVEKYDTQRVAGFTEFFLKNLHRVWDICDLPKKQALQNKIFHSGFYAGGTSQNSFIRTGELSPCFELIDALNSDNSVLVTPRRIELRFVG